MSTEWIGIKNGREFLNINTGAIIRHSCELDHYSWNWIPAIEHEINGVKRIILKFDGIRERKSVWYETTEDKEAAKMVAVLELEKFMESLNVNGGVQG